MALLILPFAEFVVCVQEHPEHSFERLELAEEAAASPLQPRDVAADVRIAPLDEMRLALVADVAAVPADEIHPAVRDGAVRMVPLEVRDGVRHLLYDVGGHRAGDIEGDYLARDAAQLRHYEGVHAVFAALPPVYEPPELVELRVAEVGVRAQVDFEAPFFAPSTAQRYTFAWCIP